MRLLLLAALSAWFPATGAAPGSVWSLILPPSPEGPSVSIRNSASNQDVQQYLHSRFPSETARAIRLAQSVAGQDLARFSLNVEVKDVREMPVMRPPLGHSWYRPDGNHRIRITVETHENGYRDEQFRSAFFHEFGHFCWDLYTEKNPRPGFLDYKASFEYESVADPSPAAQEQLMRQAEMGLVYMKVALPYRELFADAFRMAFLKTPGDAATDRDFSRLPPFTLQTRDLDEHDTLNAFRGHLWLNYVRGRLGNPAFGVRLLRALARACLEEIELRYGAAKDNFFKNPGTPYGEDGLDDPEVNRRLTKRFNDHFSN